jgi:hypothetical protein
MARRPSFSAVLCFDGFTREGRAFSIFLAEFIPVVAIVANEVGDFAKGLECDRLLEGHFDIRIEGMVDSG